MPETKNIKPKNNPMNDNKKYYDILEIKPDASFQEIKSAYFHLKKLYSSEPAVLISVIDNISEKNRQEILDRLEEAYNYLKEIYTVEEKEKMISTREWSASHNAPEFQKFDGNALRLTREVLGIELKEVALFTGVPIEHLRNIELERFDLLPPQGYVKVFLRKYAEYLDLDPKKIINDYITRFDISDKKKKNKN